MTFRIVKHRKGGYYRVLGVGLMEGSLESVTVYQALDASGTIWVRPTAEFQDGRFLQGPEIVKEWHDVQRAKREAYSRTRAGIPPVRAEK